MESIIQLFKNSYTITDIAKIHNKSRSYIRNYLKINNCYEYRKYKSRKYNFNENYFSKIDTEEKAYWLGFIAADGYIESNYRRLVISLQEKDKIHLEKLKNHIKSNFDLKYIIQKNKFNKNNTLTKEFYYRYNLELCSVILCNDLKKIGIFNNKSLILKFPNLSNKLIHHFIRGYVDGDGSWSFTKNQCIFRVTSSLNFCIKLQNIFIKRCNVKKTKLLNEGNAKTITYCGNKQCKRIRNFIYKDATIFLDRKRIKAFSF